MMRLPLASPDLRFGRPLRVLWFPLLLALFPASLPGHGSLPLGYYDVTAHGADPTGTSDSTSALQAAINHCRDNQLVMWFPGGRYLVSDRLEIDQPDNDSDFPVVMVGSSVDPANRATIVLASNAPGFDEPDARRAVVHFFNEGTADNEDGNTDLYNQGILSVDFEIGPGNDGAVALRMQGAEGCAIQDINIDLTVGGHTGIWGVPASGGATHNVSVSGGRIGIDTRKPSGLGGGGSQPQPVITGAKLVGQSDYAVYATVRGSLVLVGCEIERNGPGAVFALKEHWKGQPFDASLQLVDCVVRFANADPDNTLIEHTGDMDRSFLLDNTYLYQVTNVEAEGASSNRDSWMHYRTLAVENRPEERSWGQPVEHVMVDGEVVASPYVVATPDQKPPADLLSRHLLPSDFPSWETPGAVNVRTLGATGDGETDDWAVLQAAIDEHEVVFFPKGIYRTSKPLDLRPDSKLIGIHHNFSVIYALSSFEDRFGGTTVEEGDLPIIRTADIAIAETYLAFLHVRRKHPLEPHNSTPAGNYAIEWRCGGKSIMRLVEIQARPDPFLRPDKVAATMYGLDPDSIDKFHPRKSFGPGQYPWPHADPTIQVRGNGGGRWYTFWMHGRHGLREETPLVRVENTTQPLHIYHMHMQQQDCQNHAEFLNTENVTVYGTKGEIKGTMVYVENSRNFRLFGHSGMSSPDVDYFPPYLFRFINCDNFQISGMGDTIRSASEPRWIGGAFDRWVHTPVTDFHVLEDASTTRDTVVVEPGIRPILYLRGQTTPRSPFPSNVQATIQQPQSNSHFVAADPIMLTCQALDTSGIDVSDQVRWRSSIDGDLGVGETLDVNWLAIGEHTVTATVDGAGEVASDLITVTIEPPIDLQTHLPVRVASKSDAIELIIASLHDRAFLEFEISLQPDADLKSASIRLFQKNARQGNIDIAVLDGSFMGEAPPATATASALGTRPLAPNEETWVEIPLDVAVLQAEAVRGEPLTIAVETDNIQSSQFASDVSSESPELRLEIERSMLENYYQWADHNGLTGEDRRPDARAEDSPKANFEHYLFERMDGDLLSVLNPLEIEFHGSQWRVGFFQRGDPNLRYALHYSRNQNDWEVFWRSAGDQNLEGQRWVEIPVQDISLARLECSTF